MTQKMKYLVLDLETTGLDNKLDGILEIGAIAVDDQYNNVGCFSAIVRPTAAQLDRLTANQYVLDMHSNNGLMGCLAHGRPLDQVDAALYDWLAQCFGSTEKSVQLAGHTIGFDHGFLKNQTQHMSRLLHHRSFDYSALGVELNGLGYDIAFVPKDQMPHRALPDAIIEQRELASIMRELRQDRHDAKMYRASHEPD